MAIADITNDVYPDVIFGTDGGKVRALNGNNGSLIWTVDLAAHYGNPDFAIDHAPLVADFDNDDTLDVFIVGGHAEYPAFQNDFGRAYMISAGKGNGPDWLMFQNDIHRQSSLCTYVPSSVNEISEAPGVSVFPNPASSEIIVLFEKQGSYTIQITNLPGEILHSETAVSSQLNINISNYSKGVYFVIVKDEFHNSTVRKIVKM